MEYSSADAWIRGTYHASDSFDCSADYVCHLPLPIGRVGSAKTAAKLQWVNEMEAEPA